MKAVVLEKVGKYALVDRPIPTISGPGQLLVRIDACSICGSDMHILSDPPGYPARPGTIIGHEMTGTVVEVSQGVETFKPGDRIVCDNTARLLESGRLNLEPLITHRLSLEDFGIGYEAMKSGEALEVILYPAGKPL
jgi:threonine dehydrogenase-like Zn-dependent dehydrogenase